MRRFAAVAVLTLIIVALPCQAQFLKKLEQDLIGGQNQQGLMPGQQPQAVMVGNVNLPPGQYIMTNTQTGQAFYVAVQNGQMFLTNNQPSQQMIAPGQGMYQQQGQTGGLGGLGNIIRNELAPRQNPNP